MLLLFKEKKILDIPLFRFLLCTHIDNKNDRPTPKVFLKI